jgi:hypothetical protein
MAKGYSISLHVAEAFLAQSPHCLSIKGKTPTGEQHTGYPQSQK